MRRLSQRYPRSLAWLLFAALGAALGSGCQTCDTCGGACALTDASPYADNPYFSDSGEEYNVGKPTEPPAESTAESVVRGQWGTTGRSLAPLPSRTPPPAPLPATTPSYNSGSYNSSYQNQSAAQPAAGTTTPSPDYRNATSSGTDSTTGYPSTAATSPVSGTGYGGVTAPTSPRVGNQWGSRPKLPPMEDIAIPGLQPGGGLDDPAFDPTVQRPWDEPTRVIDINPRVRETQTGRFMLGVGVNSDAGLVGNIVLDEQNFDWTRFPRSWEEIRSATAWRGGGQRFRLEAAPGTEVQRYMATFQEPYLFDTQYTLGLSGFYYTRFYEDWDEDRVGGRIAIGRQLAPDLSMTFAYRGAKVGIFNPIVPTPPTLDAALGDSALHGFEVSLAHDTRDNAFLATEGHLFEIGFEQVVGTYSYPRINLDLRKYFLLRQRPDGSGRHVLKFAGTLGWTGDDTPIYDHYFAGGFSTLRGFEYRGASPQEWGSIVGGDFLMLASVEYLFPITADDALRGVIFCDTGTVEPTIDDWSDTYRVAPGFGLRIAIPAMGPAPIALDFAFPISHAPGDREEVFSFFVGFGR